MDNSSSRRPICFLLGVDDSIATPEEVASPALTAASHSLRGMESFLTPRSPLEMFKSGTEDRAFMLKISRALPKGDPKLPYSQMDYGAGLSEAQKATRPILPDVSREIENNNRRARANIKAIMLRAKEKAKSMGL